MTATVSVAEADIVMDIFVESQFPLGSKKLWDSWSETSHGYEISVRFEKKEEKEKDSPSKCWITLVANPCKDCESYSLMVDFTIEILDLKENVIKSCFKEYEFLEADYTIQQTLPHLVLSQSELESCEKCRVRLKVHEMLSGSKIDYSKETKTRDFALLAQDKALYVDVNYLKDLGGSMFECWWESRQKGVKRHVILNHSPQQLTKFLDQLIRFRKPVISSNTLDCFINLASEFNICKALRMCEQFLIKSQCIHPIRKLEYAAEYGLGLLGDTVMRQLGSNMRALEILHQYCTANNESAELMHPDVLEIMQIYDDCIVL